MLSFTIFVGTGAEIGTGGREKRKNVRGKERWRWWGPENWPRVYARK
jgi:hypothetical protein